MRFRPLASALGIVVLCTLAIVHATRTPRPIPADAPRDQFSAARATEHVRELARMPRQSGSEGHQRAFIYVMSRIAALGLEPRVQATTGVGTRYPVAGRVRNIVTRIPGIRPSRANAVLLVAHWDGVGAGPAAGDDAAGVAVLLETLRALRNGPLLAGDVIALFTDSEEAGLLGAAAFAREHAWASDVGVVLNFEARGTHGPSLMFETGAANYDAIRVLRQSSGARATSLSTAVYRQLPNDTDLSELAILDRPALNFAFIGGVERYHTSEDDAEHLSAGSLQHHGNQALELARRFSRAPIPRRSPRGDAVFFDLPLVGIVLYPEGWALPLAVLTLALCVGSMIAAARRRGSRYAVAALGAATLILAVCASALVAAGLAALLGRLHAALPWGGTPQWRGIYAAALACLTVAVVTSALAGARRWGAARENVRALEAGGLVALGIVAVLVTMAMPGVSFVFTWPVFLAAITAIAAHLSWRPALVGIGWLATTLIIFLLVPIIYLMVCVALGLDVVGAAALAVFTAFGCWVLLPCVFDMSPIRWRVPLAAGASSLVLIIVGLITVRTNAAYPAGVSFVYAVDSAANAAWLAGGATNAWSRAWVDRELQSRADSTRATDPPAWLTRAFGRRRIAPVAAAVMPSTSASILRDSATNDGRSVTLRVRAPGARSVQLFVERGEVLSARVDDRDVRGDRYRVTPRPWRLDYVAPSDSGFTLTLVLRSGTSHAISLVARHAGFPPGVAVPARPPGIIPIASGDVTHVYRLLNLERGATPGGD
jgi:hypothetical protein